MECWGAACVCVCVCVCVCACVCVCVRVSLLSLHLQAFFVETLTTSSSIFSWFGLGIARTCAMCACLVTSQEEKLHTRTKTHVRAIPSGIPTTSSSTSS